jgi:hypothetical protein
MFRRRRRRSAFARRAPPQLKWALYGLGGVVFIALFVFFIRQADVLAPAPELIREQVTDAFKQD